MTVVRPDSELTGGRPVVPGRGLLRPLGLAEVSIVDGFWAQRQRVNASATLDHARSWMLRLGWIDNFATVGLGRGSRERRGRAFSDSEVYKLIEAMSWEHGRTGDPSLEREIRDLVGRIAGAQAADGYLSTAFGGPGQRARYSDLATGHELYCAGHLIQAAVARARTGGGDELLDIARRLADHICETFAPGANPGLCGHPQIETGLVELARLTGEERYLRQAMVFLDRRGYRQLPPQEFGARYSSDDTPLRHATVLRGHAVRSLYLACGAVDAAVEAGDDELLAAVAAQFDRAVARRAYLTGGMGSHHADEAFGEDFELPADRAYAETCAGVATVMVAWRLLLATGEPRYADQIERVLYNVVATSIADDGRSFFYANTLHQRALPQPADDDTERLDFGGGTRAPWYEVSCCLPNLARLLASLATYLVSADDEGLRLHQYADSRVDTRLADGRRVSLQVRTRYPDDGAVSVTVAGTDGGTWPLTLRVPGWAIGASVTDRDGTRPAPPGELVLRRDFAVGETVTLQLPVGTRWVFPDPRVDAVRGCVAVERGPVVLCAESTDQAGASLDELWVDPAGEPTDTPDGATVPAVHRRLPDPAPNATRPPAGHEGQQSREGQDGQDGQESREGQDGQESRAGQNLPAAADGRAAGEGTRTQVRLVPYHRWARRGPSTMRVWLPRLDHLD